MTGLQSSTEDRVAFYQAWDGAFAKRAFEEVARQATGLAAKRRNPFHDVSHPVLEDGDPFK